MWSWIVVVVLYVLGIGFFHIIGGLGAAAETLKQWGRVSSTIGSGRLLEQLRGPGPAAITPSPDTAQPRASAGRGR